MSSRQVNIQIIEDRFGSDYEVSNDGTELRFICPYCESRGHRYHNDRKLEVNCVTLLYHCWRCGYAGILRSSRYFESRELSELGKLVDCYLNPDHKVESRNDEEDLLLYEIPPYRLVDYKDFDQYQYMRSRGFLDEWMDRYDIRFGTMLDDRSVANRVVIPNRIVSKNWTDYYTARAVYSDTIPRYRNPPFSSKTEAIYNFSRLPRSVESLIIQEGSLNAIISDQILPSIAIYGKEISKTQYESIMRKKPQVVYLSLDADARDQEIALAERFYQSGVKVKIVELPYKVDAVDLGVDRYRELVEKAIDYTPEFYHLISLTRQVLSK